MGQASRPVNRAQLGLKPAFPSSPRELFRPPRHYPVRSMESDEALMLAFQRGSREAFDELFARYRQLLYGYFRRRLASRERAEDLTQETFLARPPRHGTLRASCAFPDVLIRHRDQTARRGTPQVVARRNTGQRSVRPAGRRNAVGASGPSAPGAHRAGNPDAAGVRAAQLFGNRRADAASAEHGADAAVPVPRGAQRLSAAGKQ